MSHTASSFTEMKIQAVIALSRFIHQVIKQGLEPMRLAQAGYALLVSGCSCNSPFLKHTLASYLTATQQSDGGWADTEETLWCLGYLATLGDRYEYQLSRGKDWLFKVRLPCGAWGKNERDQPRIPVTTLATVLTPEIIDTSTMAWLTNEWESDLTGSVQLTYKGAFFLLSTRHPIFSDTDELISRTLNYLLKEQEENGGYGPWKGHPLGSDPWSTGVVLWGLSQFQSRLPSEIVDKALSWFQSNQLPNGLWPYHYLDDGASMALIGISSVLHNYLER